MKKKIFKLLAIYLLLFIFLALFVLINKEEPNKEIIIEINHHPVDIKKILTIDKKEDGEETKKNNIEDPTIEKNLSLIFAGDIIPHGSVIYGARYPNGYDFSKALRLISDEIESHDLSIINLETPVVSSKEPSGFPRFNAPPEMLDGLKDSGFNIINTNNNHLLDSSVGGAIKTIEEINKRNLLQLGTSNDGKCYRIIEEQGIKIAISSYSTYYNGLDASLDKDHPLLGKFSEERAKRDFLEMQKENPDFNISFLHWGNEYHTTPNEHQIMIAETLNKLGYDLVVGAHPHVVEPYEEIDNDGKKTLVVYSIGNFLTGQRRKDFKNPLTEDGILFSCNLKIKGDKKYIDSYKFIPIWVCNIWEEERNRYIIIPCEEYLAGEIDFDLSKDKVEEIKNSYLRTKELLMKDIR